MIRQDFSRIDAKRKSTLGHRQVPWGLPTYQAADYPHRLNFYTVPPTADITLEQFEQWAIDRLRVLSELEACSYRNKSPAETTVHMKPIMEKYLPLSANSSASSNMKAERQKDHYSHFILRLAFASTEDLRRRFSRVETMLFRLRFQNDDLRERQTFVESLNFDWEIVGEQEKRELGADLIAAGGGYPKRVDEESWFKVNWERVPELVEARKVLLKAGMAYVPGREQLSMVIAEFTARLEKALELTSRGLPRIDEDDRLTPILTHLSQNFTTPDASYSSESSGISAEINARNIDSISASFPLCMQNLHRTLRREGHLKHFGRLQYTLFLKGIGMSLEECLVFWRSGFHKKTDDEFKEYRYNVRHAYGDVGGDSNRRGNGYSPYSCQKILTDHQPQTGQTHGCPYRHFSVENLTALLQQTGVTDPSVLRGVKEDKEKQKFHLACNRLETTGHPVRSAIHKLKIGGLVVGSVTTSEYPLLVFEHAHAREIKKVKDEGIWTSAQLETIVHPNEYFKRSYLLKSLGGGKSLKDVEEKMGMGMGNNIPAAAVVKSLDVYGKGEGEVKGVKEEVKEEVKGEVKGEVKEEDMYGDVDVEDFDAKMDGVGEGDMEMEG